MAEPGRKQFIVLPLQGIRVPAMAAAAASGRFLRKLTVRPGPARSLSLPEALSKLRAYQPSLHLVPLAFYHPAVTPRLRVESRVSARTTVIIAGVEHTQLKGCCGE